MAVTCGAHARCKIHAGMVFACGTGLAGEPIAQRDKGVECNDAIRDGAQNARNGRVNSGGWSKAHRPTE